MTQDQMDEIKRQVVEMICASKELGATASRQDCQALERLQDEKLNELFKAFSTYLSGLHKAQQSFLRHVIDVAWNECTESQTVPSTDWADRMIAQAEQTYREPPCEQPS